MIDTQALVKPIGILPETAYGTPLAGFTLDAGNNQGDSDMLIKEDLTTLGYTSAHLKGLRVQITGAGGTTYHVITSISAPSTINISPALAGDRDEDDPMNLVMIPIQGRVISADNEEDTGRAVDGVVGGGQYADEAAQGAKTGKVSLEIKTGADFYKFGTIIQSYSSIMAYALTEDGIVPNDGSGVITPRDDDSSDIKSFTMAYAVKSGETRVMNGAIVVNPKFTMEEDIHSHMKTTAEIMYKKITSTLPTKVVTPDVVYKRYALRTRGHLTMNFWHASYFAQPAAPAAGTIYSKSTVGFEADQPITLYNKASDTTFDTVIQTVTPATGALTILPVLPAVLNWTEEDLIYARTTGNTAHRIVKMELEFMNNGNLTGDIVQGEDSPTQAYCGGSDYKGMMKTERDSMTIPDMIRESNEDVWFIADATLEYNDAVIEDLYIKFYAKITTNFKEELKNEREKMFDEFGFQITDIPTLRIATLPP
jgi:hypothetical protein